jgi:hypothetical protein
LLEHQSISKVEEPSVLKELMSRAVSAGRSFQLPKHSLEHFNKFRGIFESIMKEATELLPKLNGYDVGECQNLIDVVRGQLAFPLSEYSYYLPCLSTPSTPECLPIFIFDDIFAKVFENQNDEETLKENLLKYVSNNAELKSFPSGLNDLNIAFTKGLEANITLPRSDVTMMMEYLNVIIIVFQDLADSNITLVTETLDSINNLTKFIEETYLNYVVDTPRISNYPNPGSIYQGYIVYHTSTDMKAQELHDLGISEISRIEKLMEITKQKIGFNGTLQEFQKDLKDKTKYPELFAKDENDFLDIYRKTVADLFKLLPNYFEDIPKQELKVARANSRSAFYGNGTMNLNVRLLGNSSVHGRVALSIHEGVPGHHLDIGLQTEKGANMNEFYKFYFSTSYTEGWALYTEYLGEEMGAYTNEFLYFGRLDYEMLRAVRLVVDTGLHAFDWSEQRAVDFILSKTSFSEAEAREQVQRYVKQPGQALAYKIGELNFLKMRKKAEEMLGNAFDIKKFHKLILDNSRISVKAVEAMVNTWIAGGGAGKAA